MSQKKIVIHLFYVLLLASLFSAGWTYNSIARAPQSSVYTGESISADEPGLTVFPISTTETTESSGTASFTVALSTQPQPSATVTVALSSSDETEGIITDPISLSLTFTKVTWNTPQTFTVTGQNDDIDDGDIPYKIVLDPASSRDPLYDGLDNVPVEVTNIDDDTAGLTVVPTLPMQTTEGSGTASFTVALSSAPLDTVTVALNSDTPTEGIVTTPPTLALLTSNWSEPQTITVTGQNDDIDDGDIPYNIMLDPASASDTLYNGLPNVDVGVTNIDDDTAGLTVFPTFPMQTTEGSGTASFTVALSSEPLNTVTVALSSDTPAEGIVTTPPSPPLPPTLTFTSLNWNAPQTVIVTGVDDFVVDGDIPYNIVLDPASEGDALYNSLPNVDVGATNYDAPTIGWVKPVVDEGIYISDGFSPIQLEVINLSNEPINRVRFYRWVDAIGYWVTIGEALTPPYKEVLLPGELESGWNQVFAFAFGPPNPVQTFSKHVRILIIMDYGDQIHLPLVYK